MHLQIVLSFLENDNNDWRGLADMLHGAILELDHVGWLRRRR